MQVSFQGSNNKQLASDIKKTTGSQIINKELFKGPNNNHKYKIGQKLRLVGLVDYPEFNGEQVEITSIREDGRYRKAYYFKADNPEIALQLNWTYEYRLEEIKTGEEKTIEEKHNV